MTIFPPLRLLPARRAMLELNNFLCDGSHNGSSLTMKMRGIRLERLTPLLQAATVPIRLYGRFCWNRATIKMKMRSAAIIGRDQLVVALVMSRVVIIGCGSFVPRIKGVHRGGMMVGCLCSFGWDSLRACILGVGHIGER